MEGYFYIDNVQIQFEGGNGSVSPGSSVLLATIGLQQSYSGSSAQNRIGYNGQGIGVAVFDSGVSDHADLTGFSNGGTVRDEFNDRNYNNSDGSLPWNGPWVEIDEPSGSGVDDGPVQVSPNTTNCLSPKCLRVGGSKRNNPDPGFGVSRAVDLSSGSGATLSFSYRRGTYDECEAPYADLTLDISSDGGANWSTLKTYAMDGVDSNHTFESFDISEHTSANTQLRFLTHGPNNDCVFFADNIEIELAGAAPSVDFTSGSPVVAATYNDGYGHGTHVSGVIGARGSLSSGQYAGVAPGVDFLHVKVIDDSGAGYTSNLIAAIGWMIANKDAYNIRVANLSVGHPAVESFETDPLCQAVRNMVEAGIVTVVSAGNLGKASGYPELWGGITSPGTEPSVITVVAVNTKGTVTHADDMATTYSSRGFSLPDGLFKPDLVAPGNDIASLKADSCDLANQLSGTWSSIQRPHVPLVAPACPRPWSAGWRP